MLIGRSLELKRVHGVLAGACDGRSDAVVVRGEAGIGKTALLAQAMADAEARGMQVVRGIGVESETELPFGGLHMMLYPFADRFDTLPGQQAAALRSAFGLENIPMLGNTPTPRNTPTLRNTLGPERTLGPVSASGAASAGTVPDRFLIGAATLTLLSELAGQRPLLCAVDDAQWLDQASTDALFFAARRLGAADPIAMIFSVRDSARPFPTPGLDPLRLDGLDRDAAGELLAACAPALTVPVRDRLLDEAGGNPLALIELATVLEQGDAGRAPQVGPLRVGGRVQEARQGIKGDALGLAFKRAVVAEHFLDRAG